MEEGSPAANVRSLLDHGRDGCPAGLGLELEEHLLFCQMDFLCHFPNGEQGWKEAARWLKYEEKQEPGCRWSRPHVGTASLSALHKVRDAIAQHPVLFDVTSAHDDTRMVMERIANAICETQGISNSHQLLETLCSPHKHAHRKGEETSSSLPESILRTGSSICSRRPCHSKEDTLIEADDEEEGIDNRPAPPSNYGTISSGETRPQDTPDPDAYYLTYPDDLLPSSLGKHEPNKRLMRKVPAGAETANILIGKVPYLKKPVMALCRLTHSELLGDLTEIAVPTRFIFVRLAPPDSTSIWEHGEIGRAMAALFTDRVFCEVAYGAPNVEELLHGVDEYIDELTILPPSIWDPLDRLKPPDHKRSIESIRQRLNNSRPQSRVPPVTKSDVMEYDPSLDCSRQPFQGIVRDIRCRYPWYKSDITDAFHIQCIASIVFIFFACITPCVTFGGVFSSSTGDHIGVMETILGTALCGSIYHVIAGQPLNILGATGPTLVFEALLYQLCVSMNIHYLSFRFWIGMWIAFILLTLAIFNLSSIVRFITRFTEECFAFLIALIYIIEAFEEIANIYRNNPLKTNVGFDVISCHCENQDAIGLDATALQQLPMIANLSWDTLVSRDCVLWNNSFVVSPLCVTEDHCTQYNWTLAGEHCDRHDVVKSLPDVFLFSVILFVFTFGVSISFKLFRNTNYFSSRVRNTLCDFGVPIAIAMATGFDLAAGLATEKLNVPSEFKNTIPERGWVIDPMAVTYWWLAPLAFIPAFLACILFFLDQQITAVIINRKENKLKKGHGYHLDLVALTLPIALCSILGLPWFVAATVRSITHVRSLLIISEVRAPGEKAEFLGIREQRMTGLIVHILIGVSIFAASFLQHVPMAVLYGVFLYMGVSAITDIQFVDRMLLYVIPQKYHPDYPYLRHVQLPRVHFFTFIQIACMAAMWICKSVQAISIGFPLMLLAVSVVRKLLEYAFSKTELYWLDDLYPSKCDDDQEDKEDSLLAYQRARATKLASGRSHLELPDKSFGKAVEYLRGTKAGPRRLSYDAVGANEMASHLSNLRRRSMLASPDVTSSPEQDQDGSVDGSPATRRTSRAPSISDEQ